MFIDDFVKLVEIYLKNSKSFVGKKFNVGGGYKNSLSILELINFLEKNLGKKFKLNHQDERLSDQRYYVSNISSLDSEYNWKPTVDLDKGLLEFIDFVKTKNE